MVQPKLLVFDLDGTLVDSQQDLVNSVNATLRHFGKVELPSQTISGYIGEGVAVLMQRSLNHELEADQGEEVSLTAAVEWFVAYYKLHKLDNTQPYPGVLEALTLIRERHPKLLMAVLTNKPVHPSRDICAHLGLKRFFFQNYGGNSFPTKKPSPEGFDVLIAEASRLTGQPIDRSETVMIGDSHIDIETGRAAGSITVGCTWGLSTASLIAAAPDSLVETPSQWLDVLGL